MPHLENKWAECGKIIRFDEKDGRILLAIPGTLFNATAERVFRQASATQVADPS